MNHWPHAPLHLLDEKCTYMVTGATYNKVLFFKAPEDLDLLENLLFEICKKYSWHLKAWAIFPNHYHFVAQSPSNPSTLSTLINHFHSKSATLLNIKHNYPKRTVWYQYWDTKLTFHNSYMARLNYVMQNPVKHRLVTQASQYKWCSAHWFQANATKAYYNSVIKFKTDSIKIYDEFY